MTNEEAIRVLQAIKEHPSMGVYLPDEYEALDVAIEALKNERDFEKEYMKHYKQGRKDERAILNGELLQSCSELERGYNELDEDAKHASIPYTYDAPQHDWKCGYPTIKRGDDL